jgi:tRNA U38,U39,U40 pseudouridine synthase TruA
MLFSFSKFILSQLSQLHLFILAIFLCQTKICAFCFLSEIDYVGVLNKTLPRDIRVIGWCPVAADFLARLA